VLHFILQLHVLKIFHKAPLSLAIVHICYRRNDELVTNCPCAQLGLRTVYGDGRKFDGRHTVWYVPGPSLNRPVTMRCQTSQEPIRRSLSAPRHLSHGCAHVPCMSQPIFELNLHSKLNFRVLARTSKCMSRITRLFAHLVLSVTAHCHPNISHVQS
jgi:hypothetical protein